MSTIRLRCSCGAEYEGDPCSDKIKAGIYAPYATFLERHRGCGGVKDTPAPMPYTTEPIYSASLAAMSLKVAIDEKKFDAVDLCEAFLYKAYAQGRKDALK